MLQHTKNIRLILKDIADKEIAEKNHRFFKEEIKAYGIKNGEVHKISRLYLKYIKSLTKEEIFKICEELWQSGYIEEGFVACSFAISQKNKFVKEDFNIFSDWIENYITNWATCDTFCNHNMGSLIELYPELLPALKDFTKSENRWVRRAAAVSMIVPARKGLFIDSILNIADLLLTDDDDLVQKGYGWMLKVASKYHQNKVFKFVIENKDIMPRTALRYAIEKMPENLKIEAMKK